VRDIEVETSRSLREAQTAFQPPAPVATLLRGDDTDGIERATMPVHINRIEHFSDDLCNDCAWIGR